MFIAIQDYYAIIINCFVNLFSSPIGVLRTLHEVMAVEISGNDEGYGYLVYAIFNVVLGEVELIGDM